MRRRYKNPHVDFGIKRNGEDIALYPIKKPVYTGIQYEVQIPGCVPEFESWEACVASGCDLEKWSQPGGYESRFKASVVAWYRLHRLQETHSSDAQSLAIERSMRKGK